MPLPSSECSVSGTSVETSVSVAHVILVFHKCENNQIIQTEQRLAHVCIPIHHVQNATPNIFYC